MTCCGYFFSDTFKVNFISHNSKGAPDFDGDKKSEPVARDQIQ